MADVAALTAIARSTFHDTFAHTATAADMHHFLDSFYSSEQMAGELANPEDYIFFATIQNNPVGFMRFLESPVPFPHNAHGKPLELNRLYVDAAYQGRGIAQLLMNFYMEYAVSSGCRLLWLGVWEHNHRAHAFYRKYGFTFTGHRHPFPIGDTPQTDEWWSKDL